jgi:hypothetical protein
MGSTFSCLNNYPIFEVLDGSKQVSADSWGACPESGSTGYSRTDGFCLGWSLRKTPTKMNEETKNDDYDNSYRPTWNIKITESVSFSNNNLLSILKSLGSTFDILNSNVLHTYFGLYATKDIIFHCETAKEGIILLTDKEFLDSKTKELPFDPYDKNNDSAYKKYYDISSDRYTGKVFFHGLMPLANRREEKDYIYFIWQKRNGKYFYLSFDIFLNSLTKSERMFLLRLCPKSPVKFPNDSYEELDINLYMNQIIR